MVTLICVCGKRLKAAGATPGRLGRCATCGAQFRVPDELPEPPESAPPTETPIEGVRGGYGVLPAPPLQSSRYVPTGRVDPVRSISSPMRRGLIRRPARPETRLIDSLLYPFWDDVGLALLVFLPPALWATSLPVFGLVPLLVRGFGSISVLAPFAFPMMLFLAVIVGYTLLFLGGVLITSANGEVNHPRLPEWDLGDAFHGLGRWAWAGLVGFAVGGMPALAYWLRCGDIDLFDFTILSELVALGAAYTQMALVASLLHESLWAANPITVFQAIWRVGWSYIRPCLLTGFALMLAVAAFAMVLRAPGPLTSAIGLWAFWVFALYEAMVVLRVLGLFYHRHAASLGWFRDRPHWGA